MNQSPADHTPSFPVRPSFGKGFRDGLPIGFGYFAVAFSLGIAAKNAGVSCLQGFITSILTHASAGEYGIFSLIGAGAALGEFILMAMVANARYLLMSCALSQRLAPGTSFMHRLVMGFGITDEIFGVSVAQPGFLNPWYTYGAMTASIPMWACGTALGVLMGNLLPLRLVSALSVALYGMFLAIIVPPSRKNGIILILVLLSFLLSWLSSVLPGISSVSSGLRTVFLTILIASAGALIFPLPDLEENNNTKGGKEADHE